MKKGFIRSSALFCAVLFSVLFTSCGNLEIKTIAGTWVGQAYNEKIKAHGQTILLDPTQAAEITFTPSDKSKDTFTWEGAYCLEGSELRFFNVDENDNKTHRNSYIAQLKSGGNVLVLTAKTGTDAEMQPITYVRKADFVDNLSAPSDDE